MGSDEMMVVIYRTHRFVFIKARDGNNYFVHIDHGTVQAVKNLGGDDLEANKDFRAEINLALTESGER